jgi:CheY-like chemotaxis protein
MVVVIVILTIVVFILVDLALRTALKKKEEARLKAERAQALDVGLRLDYTDEAPSLKRVEVESPKARILAVDDEPVVLDSFRKILVLEGYSVDTVESAQEALGLVRKHDYEFVFTDLKMPDMDGLELTKAVNHLRPDIDVVMITGYGTIASAVETMRFGALDYVEKPFTADELADFTRKCLIRRQDRIEQQTAPTVKLVTAASGESESSHVVNVPGGIYIAPEHTWLSIEVSGEARIGLDDLAIKALESIESIEFPAKGAKIRKGESLFTIRGAGQSLVFPSALTGKVTKVHHELTYQLELLGHRPLMLGWICCLEPTHLGEELRSLRIGADAIDWYEQEIRQLWKRRQELGDDEERLPSTWQAFAETFLGSKPDEVPT